MGEWFVKVSWLGKLVSDFWCMELDLFSLECNEVSSSEFWGVFGFGMFLGDLSFNAWCCVPVFLENYRGMSCIGTCQLLGGAWIQCRYRDFCMNSCLLIFPGVGRSLMFSSFAVKPTASDFQSYS